MYPARRVILLERTRIDVSLHLQLSVILNKFNILFTSVYLTNWTLFEYSINHKASTIFNILNLYRWYQFIIWLLNTNYWVYMQKHVD